MAGLGILGGTFDPIHYGHLRMADAVRRALTLAEVRLLPAGNPYHRSASPPEATAVQRLDMARLAVAEFPGLTVDAREVVQQTPSYTVETLAGVRAEVGEAPPLLLLLGADTFLTLPGWRHWLELFRLAHLVIIARPGHALPALLPVPLQTEWMARHTLDPALLSSGAGRIYRQEVQPQPISATGIRALLHAGQRPDGLLPAAVVAYIETHSLYRSN